MRRASSTEAIGSLGRAASASIAAISLGGNDRITRFRIAEEASARFGWPLYPINDSGHFLIGERPDTFLETLRAAMGASPSDS
jgi:pimeloyl-ACP methyl ester carboxylesterase